MLLQLNWIRVLSTACIAGGLSCAPVDAADAEPQPAEKVEVVLEFSGSSEEILTPSDRGGDRIELGSGRQSSSMQGVMQGSYLPPSSSGNSSLNARALDFQSRGRHDVAGSWLDSADADSLSPSAFERAAGVRSASDGQNPESDLGTGSKPSSEASAWTRAAINRRKAESLEWSGGSTSRSVSNPVLDFGNRLPTSLGSSLSPVGLGISPPAPSSPSRSILGAGSSGTTTLRPGTARSVRDLILQSQQSPGSRTDAAMLLQEDSTRQALNPYQPENRGDYQYGASLLRGESLGLPSSSRVESQPSRLRQLTTKIEGPGSSLTPAMAVPLQEIRKSKRLHDPGLMRNPTPKF